MFYKAFGLLFRSEFPLDAAPILTEQTPDVAIHSRPLGNLEGDWNQAGICFRARPADCVLELPDVASFRILNGNEIRVVLHKPEALEDMLVILQTSALGALLYQRGRLALQASVIQKEGRATLLCGRSGAGKSALAAWLSQRGFSPVSDEIAAINDADLELGVWPGPPHWKLWTDMVAKLGFDFEQATTVRSSVLHKHLVRNDQRISDPVRIDKIVILDWWNKSDSHWEKVEAPGNFQALLRNTYRGVYAEGLGPNRDYFRSAAALARQAQVFVAIRPDGGPERLEEFGQFLLEHLQ